MSVALEPWPVTRPRIAPAVARRIDRLARRAHRWHRHAHHPLCARYAGELVQLGRRARVCRGCASALGGALLGAVAGAASPSAWSARLIGSATSTALLVALLAGVLAAAVALALAHGERKSLTRGVPAFAFAAACTLGLRRADLAGVALAAAAVLAFAIAWGAYRRRGPNRSACAACPEGPAHAGCSGFAPIVRSERAFQRLSSRWLSRG